MSSTTGGKIKKNDFSHILKVDLCVTYAFHLKGMEYLLEVNLTRWGFGKRAEEYCGFVSYKIGPFKFARMDRAKYDEYLHTKLLDVLGPMGDSLEEKQEKMSYVSPHDVPPSEQLN